MKKTLFLFFLIFTCCTHAPAGTVRSDESLALQQRADTYEKDGRYLEALTFYRDIAMNPAWAGHAGAALYKNMADIYRDYLGDTQQAALWYAKYRAAAPDAPAEPAMDKGLLSVAQPMPEYIRVLTADSASACRLSSDKPFKIITGKDTSAATDISCTADGDGIVINNAGPARGPVRVIPEKGQTVSVDGKINRGELTLIAAQGRLQVICQVPLEDYLRGVLPREMAPSWPLEALKAQAVAARTYALYHSLLRRTAAYDVLATTSSQVYDGAGKEHAAVNQAVDATRGQVLAGQDRLALTLFHANSGGQTESFADIWGGKIAYLCGGADPFSTGYSGAVWEKSLSADDIAAACSQFGIAAGDIKDITPLERSASGRIEKLQITGERQTFFLSGNRFRLIVGPGKVKGTNFEVSRENGAFLFKGTGYGHGAGMSQWGAYGMAKKGFACGDILGQYYPGTRIVQTAP